MATDKGKGKATDQQSNAGAAAIARQNAPAPQVIQYFNEANEQRGYYQKEFESAYQDLALGAKDREKETTAERKTQREAIAQKAAPWQEHVTYIVKELEIPTFDAQSALVKNDGDLQKTLLALTAPIVFDQK